MWETRSVFHISMPRLLRQDCLRCWWPITQCRVRPLRVVFHAPPLGQKLCLLQRVKDLAVQELIAQLSVEALTIPVFPRTPRLDVQRPRAHFPQPLPQLLGNKLRSVVRTNVLWYSARQHHIGQRFDHLQTQACGVVFPFAMLTSICRSIVTICSGLYLLMGITRFSSKWILSHSTWYNFRRSRHWPVRHAHPLACLPP